MSSIGEYNTAVIGTSEMPNQAVITTSPATASRIDQPSQRKESPRISFPFIHLRALQSSHSAKQQSRPNPLKRVETYGAARPMDHQFITRKISKHYRLDGMAGAAAALTVARDEGRGRGGEGQPDGGGDARVGEVGRDLRAALVARPAGAVQPQHEAAGRGALRRRRHRLGPEFGEGSGELGSRSANQPALLENG